MPSRRPMASQAKRLQPESIIEIVFNASREPEIAGCIASRTQSSRWTAPGRAQRRQLTDSEKAQTLARLIREARTQVPRLLLGCFLDE